MTKVTPLQKGPFGEHRHRLPGRHRADSQRRQLLRRRDLPAVGVVADRSRSVAARATRAVERAASPNKQWRQLLLLLLLT